MLKLDENSQFVRDDTQSTIAGELHYNMQSIDLPATPQGIRDTLRKLMEQRCAVQRQLALAERFQESPQGTFAEAEKQRFKARFVARNPIRDGDRFAETLIVENAVDLLPLPFFSALGGTIVSWSQVVPQIFNSLSGQSPIVQYGASGAAGIILTAASIFPLLSVRWILRTAEDLVVSLTDLISAPFRFCAAWINDAISATPDEMRDMQIIAKLPRPERSKLIAQTIDARTEELAKIDALIENLARNTEEGKHVDTIGMVKVRALTVDVPVFTSDANLIETILASRRVVEVSSLLINHIDKNIDRLIAGEILTINSGDLSVDAAFNGCLVASSQKGGLERIGAIKELRAEIDNLVSAYKEVQG